MLELIPMKQSEYDAFMEISMRDHIEGRIEAGDWEEDKAEGMMQSMRAQFLPDEQHTPDHHFYTLKDEETIVGGLWFAEMEQEGARFVFVFDIQVYDDFRRRGYGSQAFLGMEEKVKGLGLDMIMLNVFDHNRGARAMYEKLGYHGEGAMMRKLVG